MFVSGKKEKIYVYKCLKSFLGGLDFKHQGNCTHRKMKIGKIALIMTLCIGSSKTVFSQEEFKPSGKPEARIFMNYHTTFMDGDSKNEFALDRAYLGYQYTFSENWNAKVVYDVGNPKDDGSFELTAFLKNAYVAYQKDKLSLSFGMIGTTSFKTQESSWGYRYVAKSFMDENKFASSADLGISLFYQFNSFLSADIILINGEGYKQLEKDSIFNAGIGVSADLSESLSLRAYYETSTDETEELKRESIAAFFVGYNIEKFSLGGEYVYQTNNNQTEGNDMDGFSFYGTFRLKKINVFARFDKMISKDNWNTSLDGESIILGGEYSPLKNIKIAPNYRHFNATDSGTDDADYIFVSCEVKF